MADAAWIKANFPGYAGWNDPSAIEADYAATGGVGKEGGGGTAGLDVSQVPSVQEYVKGQFATEDPALKELIMAMRAREDPLAIYERLEQMAGLPAYRATATTLMKEIAGLEDLLLQIEPDIAARTRESLVTEAQRRGLVTAGREPHLEKLGTLGTALGRIMERMGMAERGIGTKAELAMRGQEMKLEPLQLYYSTMVDRNARLLSGFTADRQTQLDILWDKLKRTRHLEDREWELANELASEERTYMRTLQTSAAEAGATLTGDETADEILALIGITAAEAIQWERRYKERKLAEGEGGYEYGGESEWEIVEYVG